MYHQIFLDICNRNPNASGKTVYDENRNPYGRVENRFHTSRTPNLQRADWRNFVEALMSCIPNQNWEGGMCEIVVAGFTRQFNNGLPIRDFHVLGSYSYNDAQIVYKTLLSTFMNWTNTIPDNPNINQATNENTIYDHIYPFCRIRQGRAGTFGIDYSPTMQYLINLLNEHNIEYLVDTFTRQGNYFHNIIVPGNSRQIFTAHHDRAMCWRGHGKIAGANDNSCSNINLIALKIARPDAYIVFTDAEELGPNGAWGAKRVVEIWESSKKGVPITINNQQIDWSDKQWIVNLELTGSGGRRFFYGSYNNIRVPNTPNNLSRNIHRLFDRVHPVPQMEPPFCDSVVFVQNGIDSVVINPLPPLNGNPRVQNAQRLPVIAADGTPLDFSIVALCNCHLDTLDNPWITTQYMQEFVEEVLCPLADVC